MAVEETGVATIEYRIVVVHARSRKIIVFGASGGPLLPCISIPLWTRPAREVQHVIQTAWGFRAIVLDFLGGHDEFPCCAVVELLEEPGHPDFRSIVLDDLSSSEISERQRSALASLLSGSADRPFSSIGWIYEAVAWVNSATGKRLSPQTRIEQHNAGGAFALVRFATEDGLSIWLKATGEPNAHEFAVTKALSELAGEHLPELISDRPAWNAWLMRGEDNLADLHGDGFQCFHVLKPAVESMAKLQMNTEGHRLELLEAGAFDQGADRFIRSSQALFEYVEEAMVLQTSTKVPRLERARLQAIRGILDAVCRRTEDLDLPETVVHGDLHQGNILAGNGSCQFIDWSEAYVGNPLISLQRLLLLNTGNDARTRDSINRLLIERYRRIWSASRDPRPFNESIIFMPLLSLASALLGRSNWLESSQRNNVRRQSYARTLARKLDASVREPGLQELLCQ